MSSSHWILFQNRNDPQARKSWPGQNENLLSLSAWRVGRCLREPAFPCLSPSHTCLLPWTQHKLWQVCVWPRRCGEFHGCQERGQLLAVTVTKSTALPSIQGPLPAGLLLNPPTSPSQTSMCKDPSVGDTVKPQAGRQVPGGPGIVHS